MVLTVVESLKILFLLCILDTESQICSSDEECSDNQICGADPSACFSRFNATDFTNITILVDNSGDGRPGDTATSYDPLLLLDGDSTTGVTINNPLGSMGIPQSTFINLNIPTSLGYWIQGMEFVIENPPTIFDIYINSEDPIGINDLLDDPTAPDDGNTYYILDTSATDIQYPFFLNNLSINILQSVTNLDLYGINLYGAKDSPVPTEAPTESPTEPTGEPSESPTPAPTNNPTPAPTDFPTPDVCDEFMVTQSCCGNYGYVITSDKLNRRDESLTTCEYTFEANCCGTLGGWAISSSKQGWGCGGSGNLDKVICDPSFWDSSIDQTDDIYGPVVNATDSTPGGWPTFLSTTAVDLTQLRDASNNYCTCSWTVYECNGTDAAICGSSTDYEDLFALDCWNYEYDNETYTAQELPSLINDTCWKDNEDDFAYLLNQPCSEESFLGSVTSIEYIPNETILEDDCSCDYAVRNCRILEDKTTVGTCYEEVVNPCCATDFDYDYRNFTREGINATLIYTLDEDTGRPLDDGWSCRNELDLCPDLWNGSRKYEVNEESRVDWWVDNGEIGSICGCKYIVDECNLPSKDPTGTPTGEPTAIPTFEPTQGDTGAVYAIKLSFTVMIMVIFSIISSL